jgi:hypothetical protein
MITKVKVKCEVDIIFNNGEEDSVSVVCEGTANIERELYGSDMDGNRGVWQTFIEDEEYDEDDLRYKLEEEYPDMESYKVTSCEFEDYE